MSLALKILKSDKAVYFTFIDSNAGPAEILGRARRAIATIDAYNPQYRKYFTLIVSSILILKVQVTHLFIIDTSRLSRLRGQTYDTWSDL